VRGRLIPGSLYRTVFFKMLRFVKLTREDPLVFSNHFLFSDSMGWNSGITSRSECFSQQYFLVNKYRQIQNDHQNVYRGGDFWSRRDKVEEWQREASLSRFHAYLWKNEDSPSGPHPETPNSSHKEARLRRASECVFTCLKSPTKSK